MVLGQKPSADRARQFGVQEVTAMLDDKRRLLALELQGRQSSGVVVQAIGDQIPDSLAGKCHDNVDRWVDQRPEHRRARGWLVARYLAPPLMMRFLAHSVVETETGELIDITLSAAEPQHLFIRHPGSNVDFDDLVVTQHTPWVDCPLLVPC